MADKETRGLTQKRKKKNRSSRVLIDIIQDFLISFWGSEGQVQPLSTRGLTSRSMYKVVKVSIGKSGWNHPGGKG